MYFLQRSGRRWLRALELVADMAQSRVVHNTIANSAAVGARKKGGHLLQALELMAEMAQGRVNVKPSRTMQQLSLIHI